MKKSSPEILANESAFARFVQKKPIVSLVVLFFYMVGVIHTVDDLFHYGLGWPLRAGHEYKLAAIVAITLVLVRPILLRRVSYKQSQTEKEILEQAAAIERAARLPDASAR